MARARSVIDDQGQASFTSTAITSDGNAIISYHNSIGGNLGVAVCDDPQCLTADLTVAPGSENYVGAYGSIAIGNNNRPVISYVDATTSALKLILCFDPRCESMAPITLDDSSNFVGQTALAIGPSGKPVVSYLDLDSGSVKVAACTDEACTGSYVTTIADYEGFFTTVVTTSIAIGPAGNPVISHYQPDSREILVSICDNPTCTGTITTRPLDSGQAGLYSSVAIGRDGNPVIAYYQSTDGARLKIAVCSDPLCASSSIRDVAPGGHNLSLTITSTGLPIVAHVDNNRVWVTTCGDPACASATTTRIGSVQEQTAFAGYPSIAVGLDGRPVIAYSDSASHLSVATCGNPTCSAVAGRSR